MTWRTVASDVGFAMSSTLQQCPATSLEPVVRMPPYSQPAGAPPAPALSPASYEAWAQRIVRVCVHHTLLGMERFPHGNKDPWPSWGKDGDTAGHLIPSPASMAHVTLPRPLPSRSECRTE